MILSRHPSIELRMLDSFKQSWEIHFSRTRCSSVRCIANLDMADHRPVPIKYRECIAMNDLGVKAVIL